MSKKAKPCSSDKVGVADPLSESPSLVVSLDIGSQKITGAILRPDRSLVLKPAEFDN